MRKILISNESFYDKDYNSTFSYLNKYKFFSVSIDSFFPGLFEQCSNLLVEALGNEITQQEFRDRPLTKIQTETILSLYSKLLENLKEERGPIPPPKSKADLIKNRDLVYYETLIEICNECLNENKPMFLSIEN